MGRINDRLRSFGYTAKERAYIYGGAIVGLAAPVVAARCLLLGNESGGTTGEIIAWGEALLINASSMVVSPHLPVPAYTGLVGMSLGTIMAQDSRRKRSRKKSVLAEL